MYGTAMGANVNSQIETSMDSFIADYHETEEAFPLVYDLGRISLEWNMVDHFFTMTIQELLGHYPINTAGQINNISKADVVRRLARKKIKDKDALNAIEFACGAFSILRVNRNALLNSHSVFRGEKGEKPRWRRTTGNGPIGYASVEAALADLEQVISDICDLGKFVVALVPFLHRRRQKGWQGAVRPNLPNKFPMPTLLAQTSGSLDDKANTRARSTKRGAKSAPKRACDRPASS
jgi:hypothetical protein